MGVVHAHGGVVIDCRVHQESVIRIVSTMGTKESISYKMISHGSWYRQIEKRERESDSQNREKERERNGEREKHSRKKKKKEEKKRGQSGEVEGESA